MTVPSDYLCHDAIGLAQLVAQREVSARELLDAAIGRAQALNPAINAIVLNDYAAARDVERRAARVARPPDRGRRGAAHRVMRGAPGRARHGRVHAAAFCAAFPPPSASIR